MTNQYDYMKVTVDSDLCSQYIDGYANFGWHTDENIPSERFVSKITLHFKRNRTISNKTELTRLQRHYEACMQEIASLEASKDSVSMIVSLSCGVIGCVFVAGSVFAAVHQPPILWLMILLAIPGFALWAAAGLGYRAVMHRRTAKVMPLIDAKYDEACAVCEKGHQLLG